MRITVSTENHEQPGIYDEIAVFKDSDNSSTFIKSLLDIAYEEGKTNILVSVDFPEFNNAK